MRSLPPSSRVVIRPRVFRISFAPSLEKFRQLTTVAVCLPPRALVFIGVFFYSIYVFHAILTTPTLHIFMFPSIYHKPQQPQDLLPLITHTTCTTYHLHLVLPSNLSSFFTTCPKSLVPSSSSFLESRSFLLPFRFRWGSPKYEHVDVDGLGFMSLRTCVYIPCALVRIFIAHS